MKTKDIIVVRVNVSGGAITGVISNTPGVTVSRTGAGIYDTRLPSGYMIISVTGDSTAGIPASSWTSSTANRIILWSSNTAGTALDTSFTFMAAKLG